MRVMFINNDGGGFASFVQAPPGSTIEQFLAQHCPDRQPEDLLIRVNRQPVPRDYVLQEDDRISATPTKIQGAA